jgi:hypothetical protein
MLRLFLSYKQLATVMRALTFYAKSIKTNNTEEASYVIGIADRLMEQSDMDHTRVADLEAT